MATVSDTGICREGAIVPPRGSPSGATWVAIGRYVGRHRALRGSPSYRHVGCHRALRGSPSGATWVAIVPPRGLPSGATWVAIVPPRGSPSGATWVAVVPLTWGVQRLQLFWLVGNGKTNSFSSFPAAFFPSATVVTIANIFMFFIYRFFAQLFLHRIKDKPDTNKQQSNRFNNSDNSQKSILTPNKRDGIYRREVCKVSRPLASLKITFKISARSASNAVKT